MSCINCGNKNDEGLDLYPCLCDQFVHPLPLNIGAGLSNLPRQIATFPGFRRAMLQFLKSTQVEIIDKNNITVKLNPLLRWRARDKDDLGIMLLEMWAYICDCLSFYDEVIANETYLRTSVLRPDVRRLVALLGYLPRPAVGSRVNLAALADGRLQLKLPAGTAFRSGAFNGNPPQVFELDKDAIIHPLNNRWKLLSPHPGKIISDNPDSLLVATRAEIREDDLLLITNKNSAAQGVKVKKVEKYTGRDQHQYTKITFTSATTLKAGTLLEDLRLVKFTQSGPIWTGDYITGSSKPGISTTTATANSTTLLQNTNPFLVLDVSGDPQKLTLKSLVPQITAGSFVLVTRDDVLGWYKVVKSAEINVPSLPSGEIKVNGATFKLPGITIPVTQLTLDEKINSATRKSPGARSWTDAVAEEITVYYVTQIAATVVDEPKSTLSPGDTLALDGFIEAPTGKISPTEFLLQDKNTLGTGAGGSIDYEAKKLILDKEITWNPELTLPVEVYGNIITASRGEKVTGEVMGSGDASLSNQTFKLKKKPLTYHLSPTADNDDGVASSLSVYVNGVKWSEVNNFYGKKENDQVYIVRQDDEADSLVTFGDGIRGQRLPSGMNNIIASYRFGGGSACPPAGSVNQIAKPVKNLQSVKNILAAFGGADAEPAGGLKIYAPKSALILGRVVSMKDMEALASQFPGVRAVQAEWRWNKGKQSASAHIFYIGEDGLAPALSTRLRNLADPSLSISIEKATPIPLNVSLNVQIDPRYLEDDVLQQLRAALLDKTAGLLAPENVGIGQPLYRSKIFGEVLKLAGVDAVESIQLNGNNFNEFAITPGTGNYFDVEEGKLILNGKDN